MTDEELARHALAPLIAETPHPPFSTRPSGFLGITFEALVERVPLVCAKARDEGYSAGNAAGWQTGFEMGSSDD